MVRSNGRNSSVSDIGPSWEELEDYRAMQVNALRWQDTVFLGRMPALAPRERLVVWNAELSDIYPFHTGGLDSLEAQIGILVGSTKAWLNLDPTRRLQEYVRGGL